MIWLLGGLVRKTQFESRRGKLNKYSSKLVKISILLFLIWKNIFHLLWYQNWNEENWQKDTWYKKVWHFSKNNKNVAFFWNTTYTLVTSSFPGRVCIYLICVLCNRHPFSNNGIFPNFIEQKILFCSIKLGKMPLFENGCLL